MAGRNAWEVPAAPLPGTTPPPAAEPPPPVLLAMRSWGGPWERGLRFAERDKFVFRN